VDFAVRNMEIRTSIYREFGAGSGFVWDISDG